MIEAKYLVRMVGAGEKPWLHVRVVQVWGGDDSSDHDAGSLPQAEDTDCVNKVPNLVFDSRVFA